MAESAIDLAAITDSQQESFQPAIQVKQLVDASNLCGKTYVRFERHNNKTLLVCVNNEDNLPAIDPNESHILELPNENESTSEKGASDQASIWSFHAPNKNSSKLASVIGWMCVAYVILTSVFRIITIAFQDGSTGWVTAFVLSEIFANEVVVLLIPFLFCVCPTYWQALWFFIIIWFTYLSEIILFWFIPFWDNSVDFDLIFVIVTLMVVILFTRRVHLYLSSLHHKGRLLEMLGSVFKYYVVLAVPEVIKLISQIVSDSGNEIATANIALNDDGSYSAWFALVSMLFIVLVYIKFSLHPQANSVFDLLGLMAAREFVPFVLIFIQFCLFVVVYIVTFANVSSSALLGVVWDALFYVIFLIVVIQLIAMAGKNRWLSWVT